MHQHASAPQEIGDGQAPLFGTFIFDLDGTLLNTLPDLVVLTNAVLRECGFLERTSDEILSFVGNGVKALMYQAVPEDADEKAIEAAMQRWKALYPQYGHRLTLPYEGVLDVLAELKRRGVKLAVLSNKFDEGVQDVVQTFLPDLFEAVHGECELIPRKPNPAGLLYTIDELGAERSDVVYVGDSPVDVQAAHNAGVHCVAVSWGYHNAQRLQEADADAVVDGMQDLLAYAR